MQTKLSNYEKTLLVKSFANMSVFTKKQFLTKLMIECPSDYAEVVDLLGKEYKKVIGTA
jgi:hypothetical protein